MLIAGYIHSHSMTSQNEKRFSVVLCELHNKRIHGFNKYSDPNIIGHYLVIDQFDMMSEIEDMEEVAEYYNFRYLELHNKTHSLIRNYHNIIVNEKYIQPHIAECIYLNGDECVAILKTCWIKIIQRAWKRVYAERIRIQNIRQHPSRIRYKEIRGRWPDECCRMPSLYGMLGIV